MTLSLILKLVVATTSAQSDITQAEKLDTINSFTKELHANYVQPQIAKNIEAALRNWSRSEDYQNIASGEAFANRINDLMKKEVTDGHLWIRYSKEVLPPRQKATEASKEEIAQEKRDAYLSNGGFRKVERLAGNVGYLKIDFFHDLKYARRPMEAAMNFLANTDAIIVDLRDHSGGYSETCDHFASYFFPAGKPTKISTLYDRKLNKTIEIYTATRTFGPRYTKPTYVLTNKNTGSAGEAVAYNLKTFKRATLIGKSTYGIANMGDFVRVNDHFMSFIPYAQGRNPITGTNWESTGVIPDIDVDPTEALQRAQIEALELLLKQANADVDKKAYTSILARIRGESK